MNTLYYLCFLIKESILWIKNNYAAMLVGGGIALFFVSLILTIL